MTKHAPTPWKIEKKQLGEWPIWANSGMIHRVATAGDEANARRICAAVNACGGISTEALENGVVKELLASSIKFSEALRNNYSDAQLCLEERDAWRSAIEKAMAP
jgi:hypothetical protein